MKKRIIFASMLLVLGLGLTSFAPSKRDRTERDNTSAATTTATEAPQFEDRVSDEAIARCKTIIAYYFNQVATPDQYKEKSCPAEWTINEVLAQLNGTQETSIALTKEIAAIEPMDKSLAAVEATFTSAIYQDKNLEKINTFLNKDDKRKSDIEYIKPTIDNEIKVILRQDESQRKEAFKKQQAEAAKATQGDDGKETKNGGNIGIALLGVLLGLIGTGLGGYCFWQMRKMQETIRKQKGRVKELREQVGEMESMKTTINGLKSNLGNLQNEIDERLTQMNRNNMRTNEAPRNTHQATQQAAPQRPTAPAAPAEPQVLYAGLPSGDVFADAKAQNTPKSFYKIELRGGNVGEYEFISNPTTINYAKSSTTNFIECACNIVENASGFSNVITTRKGKVEKAGNDWRIVQKAEVRLS